MKYEIHNQIIKERPFHRAEYNGFALILFLAFAQQLPKTNKIP